MNSKQLMGKYRWVQFTRETNRWHLEQKWSALTVEELFGEDVSVIRHHSAGASMVLFIVRLEDGGVISYQSENGQYLHTLNTLTTFKRKIWDLGLWTPGQQD
jgi:hypothetical protein